MAIPLEPKTKMGKSNHRVESLFEHNSTPAEFCTAMINRSAQLLQSVSGVVIAQLIDIVDKTILNGNSILIIGNGGSSAVASHMVDDLVVGTRAADHPPVRALSLTDNVASITAIANDVGYEHIFSHQLSQHLQPNDLVIALSVSGNSPNIVRGIEYANTHDAFTVGLCGLDGGWLLKNTQLAIHIPSTADEFGAVEGVFGSIGHTLSTYLTLKRNQQLCHCH